MYKKSRTAVWLFCSSCVWYMRVFEVNEIMSQQDNGFSFGRSCTQSVVLYSFTSMKSTYSPSCFSKILERRCRLLGFDFRCVCAVLFFCPLLFCWCVCWFLFFVPMPNVLRTKLSKIMGAMSMNTNASNTNMMRHPSKCIMC